MATTAYTFSSDEILTEIVEITLSSTTGATSNIVLEANSFFGAEFVYETIGSQNAHAEMGNPVKTNVGLNFTLKGLGAQGDWEAINELSENNIAYVKIQFMSGQTVILNSGSDDKSIMYFNHKLINGDVSFGIEVTGARNIPYKAMTIS